MGRGYKLEFLITVEISPSGRFGVPQAGWTVQPGRAGESYGDTFHSDTGIRVGFGTLPEYRAMEKTNVPTSCTASGWWSLCARAWMLGRKPGIAVNDSVEIGLATLGGCARPTQLDADNVRELSIAHQPDPKPAPQIGKPSNAKLDYPINST